MSEHCENRTTSDGHAIAQRMHGRENYSCGREEGHDGPHRWPDKPQGPYIVEWEAPDAP